MRVLDGISMVVRILSASEGRPTKEDMDERACRLAAYMIETGATVRVPLFINEGETIEVDTRDGSYCERVR